MAYVDQRTKLPDGLTKPPPCPPNHNNAGYHWTPSLKGPLVVVKGPLDYISVVAVWL